MAGKRALITGVTGQDGSYLTELLLSKGYSVHGTTRNQQGESAAALFKLPAISSASDRVQLHQVELSDAPAIERLVHDVQPHEIYHLAAQSHVGQSFSSPMETIDANVGGTVAILEAARTCPMPVRIYQASSSEMFGATSSWPQTETTPFEPRNPYACSKVCAYHLAANYREAHGLFVCNGILYNHESPRRPERYVTRKITLAAARIASGLQKELVLGNLDVGRDWGYAKEFVEAMWLMLQQDDPDDFIVATNTWHTLREFLDAAFQSLDLDWNQVVRIDPSLLRPTESLRLQGDYSKAFTDMGWKPDTEFSDLVELMVQSDLELVTGRRTSLAQQDHVG